MIADFVRHGVQRNEKMLYILDVHSASQLRQMLEQAGVAVKPALVARGQLVLVTARATYLQDSDFDPGRMIALVAEETDTAIAVGYSALRCTGEMTWALAGEPGSERLIEYESRLNHFFPKSKCYAICQYDRRRFDSEMLLDVLHSHPKVLYGREGFDNSRSYYVPPDAFLGGDRQGAILDRWLENLAAGAPGRLGL